MDGTSEGELKPKRARRTRATKTTADQAVASTGSTRIRATRQRAERSANKKSTKPSESPEPVSETTGESIEKTEVTRKAPTPLSAIAKEKRTIRNRLIIVSVILIIGVASSAAVGTTDKGLINVNGTIEARNQQAIENGASQLVVPVQNTNQLPDGGLVGLGVGAAPPSTTTDSTADTATSTATSTEDDATPVGNVPATEAEAEAATDGNTATSSAGN